MPSNRSSSLRDTRCRDHVSQEFTGILLCGDIAGYGALTAYAEHMGVVDGVDHEAVLRKAVPMWFTALFAGAGISHVHTAGDGFVCALPVIGEHESHTDLKRFANAYAAYLREMDQLSEQIAEHSESFPTREAEVPTLGSHLAVHRGVYRYGKMSVASPLVSFDGASVVTASRLEQSLKSISKTPALTRKYGIVGERHLALASSNVTDVSGEILFPGLFDGVGVIEGEGYRGRALLMRLAREKA